MISLRTFGGLLAACLLAVLAGPPPALAQVTEAPPAVEAPPAAEAPAEAAADAPAAAARAEASDAVTLETHTTAPDYAAWERTAMRAEALTEDPAATDEALDRMRGFLVGWRTTFQEAQSVNQARIATLRAQIDALGAPPAEGAVEAPEIAGRRTALGDQLARLEAPRIAADEAWRRAEGLISEVDRIQRERQADALLRLSPSPLNPAHWPAALLVLRDAGTILWRETEIEWQLPSSQITLRGNLPLIIGLVVLALALVLRGPATTRLLERWVDRGASDRWRRIWALPLSLGQIVLPVLGLVALAQAAELSSLFGLNGRRILGLVPALGLIIATALWIARQVFPVGEAPDAPLTLSPDQRAEGRTLVNIFGLVVVLDVLTTEAMTTAQGSEAAASALQFPGLVIASYILFRIGVLLRAHTVAEATAGEAAKFRNRLIGLVGRASRLIALVGPVLGAIGYTAAADALVYPMAISLGLLGVLFILQRLVDHLWALASRTEDDSEGALVPTLIGFAFALASVPIFALIWGARAADIAELWGRFLQGLVIGETRIAPTNFLIFVAVFAIGYAVMRLVQGALRTSILPKTKLDPGGRTSVLSGVGYVGVFLAALIAINAAGIDLSGFAVVAGALSVGIGFGLQNIVSNFVSGIILLVERPVSEGDWIEVGTTQGIVKAISVRSTRIQTFDRSDVIVPNTDLIAGRVTNWTRYNLTGRLIVPIAVAYGTDPRLVDKVLFEIAEAQPLAVLNPKPQVLFMGFNADAMLFELRLILRDVNFQLQVRSEINHAIIRRFGEAGILLALSMGAQAQAGPLAAPED